LTLWVVWQYAKPNAMVDCNEVIKTQANWAIVATVLRVTLLSFVKERFDSKPVYAR
jgi:hypothetical protein